MYYNVKIFLNIIRYFANLQSDFLPEKIRGITEIKCKPVYKD